MSDVWPALVKSAYALRPVLADHTQNGFVYFSATTFTGDAWAGCSQAVKFLLENGYASMKYPDNSELDREAILDVLNKDHGIVQDFHLTQPGLFFLCGKWGLRQE